VPSGWWGSGWGGASLPFSLAGEASLVEQEESLLWRLLAKLTGPKGSEEEAGSMLGVGWWAVAGVASNSRPIRHFH